MPYPVLNKVLNDKRAINTELMMMEAAPLLFIQNEYDMLMAEHKSPFPKRYTSDSENASE